MLTGLFLKAFFVLGTDYKLSLSRCRNMSNREILSLPKLLRVECAQTCLNKRWTSYAGRCIIPSRADHNGGYRMPQSCNWSIDTIAGSFRKL